MAGVSTYLANKILDHVLRNLTYTPPATVYIALYTSDPGDDDTGTEVSGAGYTRMPVTFSAASNRQITNDADVEFPEAGENWGTITHVGLRDASTGGNLLVYGPLTTAKTVEYGDQIVFKAGSITVYFT